MLIAINSLLTRVVNLRSIYWTLAMAKSMVVCGITDKVPVFGTGLSPHTLLSFFCHARLGKISVNSQFAAAADMYKL